jgi:hypothetical protein
MYVILIKYIIIILIKCIIIIDVPTSYLAAYILKIQKDNIAYCYVSLSYINLSKLASFDVPVVVVLKVLLVMTTHQLVKSYRFDVNCISIHRTQVIVQLLTL